MTAYKIERMNNCIGEDEHNSDGYPSDDNLEPEKDDSLKELDTTISSLVADKHAKKVTKRGGRKAQPHNQSGRLTRSNANKAIETEISN
ncbi:hypothetical protein SORBI_3006G062750 [Sorghum bicolor]|uniref:Uncharacterized protein n=1 Tax=Sorghum bicolor TaxID=4558 RepID=A0A1Z5RCM1_SORBI|nr:hypothetical protein SORBI_3006G062750 [Sorghum bicolor]